ncbi:MAG: PDR/VanB family oxidoreductase [Tistlia sp.]|uniref:PDR/VanB family oxidoreductase n=1 Tax=Tistlia sp. TaxID=3057121 RepID=UPI0034A21E5E
MAEDPIGSGLRPLLVRSKRQLTPDIWRFELVDPEGGELPPFEAGAHVTVETPSGARRTYSLSNDPAERDRYVLGVKQERAGRGGSTSLIEQVGEGDRVPVSAPINRFPLQPAGEYLFVAGGIGITPILAMLRQVAREGEAKFKLVYCTRSPELTAFREELQDPAFAGKVRLHHDDGDPDKVFDFWELFEKPGKAHVYCCGPRPLMEEVRAVTGHWPEAAIHFEDFASDVEAIRPDDRSFAVRNARTGERVEIPADATILETLRARGHRLPSSCESGTCGSCKTRLVEGEAEHRDLVLSEAERADHLMICVSRAKSDELVLEW